MNMNNSHHKHMPKQRWGICVVFVHLLVTCTACIMPESRVILQTRIVDRHVTREVTREVTRLVQRVVTPSPAQGSAPPVVRVQLPVRHGATVSPATLRRLQALLEHRTGFEVQLLIADDQQRSLEAVCDDLADVAWMTTPEYLLAHERCGARARFQIMGERTEMRSSQIIVQAASVRQSRGAPPISVLDDLQGMSFGFTDLCSITGYLVPQAMLIDANIRPAETVFLGGDLQAVLAVYTGEVDGAAVLWTPLQSDGVPGDARAGLLDGYPDVTRVVETLQLSAPIPNDPVVFRVGLRLEMEDQLRVALVDLAQSKEGREVLGDLCGSSGLVPVQDSDYDVLRDAVSALGITYEYLLRRDYAPYAEDGQVPGASGG